MAQEQSPELGAYAREAFRWLYDAEMYASLVPPIEQHPYTLPTRLSDEDIAAMRAGGRIAPLAPGETPKGLVNIFTVDEVDKGRRRIILDATINRYVERHVPAGLRIQLPSRQDCRQDVHAAPTQAQLDYAAYYDQFALGKGVQLYFCFQNKDGVWFKWLRLPMGFTHSCAVACAATWTVAGEVELNLKSGGRGSAHSRAGRAPKPPTEDPGSNPGDTIFRDKPPIRRTYIDNLRYAGSATQVTAYTEEFKRVSNLIGATLNDSEGEKEEEAFLGELYSFSQKTKASTPKTIRKLRAALALLDSNLLARRKWAAIFGIMLYACPTSDIPLSECYDLLLFYRRQVCSGGVDSWGELVGAPQATNNLMREVLGTLITNLPTPCREESEPGTQVHIVTDASEWGWGAITWRDGDDSFISLHAQPWPYPSPHDVRHSAIAEPLAAKAAVYRFAPPATTGVVLYGDHLPFLQACVRGHAHSPTYNEVIRDLARIYPATSFSLRFLPGRHNTADFLSRGLADPQEGMPSSPAEIQARSQPVEATKRQQNIFMA